MTYHEGLQAVGAAAERGANALGDLGDTIFGTTFVEDSTYENYSECVNLTWLPDVPEKPKTNCRNCGAANHKPQCEYCGTEN